MKLMLEQPPDPAILLLYKISDKNNQHFEKELSVCDQMMMKEIESMNKL
jgi:hypothetical protein